MGLFGELMKAIFPPPKKYGTLSVTIRGEQVKSHGEQKIADFLSRSGIRYEYERPIEVGIWIFNNELCRPDFYLPEYDVYIEYWGMLDVEDGNKRREYERKMKWKMAQYYRYKIKFISIYPRNLRNFEWIIRKQIRALTGKELPGREPHPRRQFTSRGSSGAENGQLDRSGPACPKCGSPMVKRMAKQGPNAGKPFWGCAQWSKTKCSGIIKI